MVGRALDREVERDLDPVLAAGRHEPVEVLVRAEVGMDRVVTTLGTADRPRAAGVARLRDEGVVLALAVRRPDRVHRRQVEDVEAELRELRQGLLDALEPSPGPGEELVPGAEARPLPLDVGLERGRRDLAVAVLRAESGRSRVPLLEPARAEEQLGLGRLAGEIGLAGRDLPVELVEHRRVAVDPRLDRVLPAPELRGLEASPPAIVADRLERALLPLPRARGPVADDRAQDVVPVLEDRRRELDGIALRHLDGIASAIDLRPDVLNLDAGRELSGGG